MIIFIETTFSHKYGFQRGSHKIKNTKYTFNYKMKRTRYQLKSVNQRFKGARLKIYSHSRIVWPRELKSLIRNSLSESRLI